MNYCDMKQLDSTETEENFAKTLNTNIFHSVEIVMPCILSLRLSKYSNDCAWHRRLLFCLVLSLFWCFLYDLRCPLRYYKILLNGNRQVEIDIIIRKASVFIMHISITLQSLRTH
jgi:hypothetical protein